MNIFFAVSVLENKMSKTQGKYLKNGVYNNMKNVQLYKVIYSITFFLVFQYAQALIAEWGWKWLDKYHPNFIGKPNPNNAKIKAVFGDQGGH